MNSAVLFEKLAQKFRFTEPACERVQKLALKTGRPVLKSILKKNGVYSPLFGKYIDLMYLTRKVGFRATFLQIKILFFSMVFGTMLALVGVLSLRDVIPVSKILSEGRSFMNIAPGKEDQSGTENKKSGEVPQKKEQNGAEIEPESNHQENDKSKKRTAFMERTKLSVGVGPFLGSDTRLAEQVEDILARELKREMGQARVALLRDKKNAPVPSLLTGSVRKVDNTIYITAKIIHVETSAVTATFSRKINEGESVEKILLELSEEIAEKLREKASGP